MHTAQKQLALGLINETLYKRQSWHPSGRIIKNKFALTTATTKIGKNIITLDYTRNTITVNRKRQRLPKAISIDLLTIVKLKTAKTIKKYATSNSAN